MIVIVVSVALPVTNASTGPVAFGEGLSPMRVVAIMFVATMGGIVTRYFFEPRQGQFPWGDCLKTLAITPILLLPLLGSIQSAGTLNPMQLVVFACLAFQNGFFWHAVLEKAKTKQPPQEHKCGSGSPNT